jgi:hypothetical protein
MVFVNSLFSIILYFIFFLAWQEPHNEQNIIEISRSTNVISVEQHIIPSNNIETSPFIKYIQENTHVSYDILSISSMKF